MSSIPRLTRDNPDCPILQPHLLTGNPAVYDLLTSSIAAGAFFTLFIARTGPALGDLTRWPEEIKSSDVCLVCRKKQVKDDDPLLECERCEDGCHLGCLDPPLTVRLSLHRAKTVIHISLRITHDGWSCHV